MRSRLWLTAVVLLAGCTLPTHTQLGRPGMNRPTAPREAIVTSLTARAPFAATQLIGKVKLLSDKGLGIISNNSGGLISDQGGSLIGEGGLGLISDRGGALVSNNGGGIVSTNGGSYRTLGADGPTESWLAEARIEVVDAAGEPVRDAHGEPVVAMTDETGAYMIEAELPREVLVLRVRLFGGGELRALVPNGGAASLEVSIDTVSSLGAGYVLERYVKGAQAVLNRLPLEEASALYAEVAASARAGLTGTPRYEAAALAERTGALASASKPLLERLERIESLLLAGQADLGNGLQATEVGLSMPVAVALAGDQRLFIAEGSAGRVRVVEADGTIGTFGETGARGLGFIGDMAMRPDGGLVLALPFAGSLAHFGPAGAPLSSAPGAGLGRPTAIALGPDGTLHVGRLDGGLVRQAASGAWQPIPSPPFFSEKPAITGLAVGPDGTLYALDSARGTLGQLPPGGAWRQLADGLAVGHMGRLLIAPEGGIYLTEDKGHRLVHLSAEGARRVVAGTGTAGRGGDGGPAAASELSEPAGMFLAPDGTLYVAEAGAGRVRSIGPDGTITTVAGAREEGPKDATSVSVNQPGGLAVDAAGRVVWSELGSSTIKRLEGGEVTTLAGAGKGFGGDEGPATEALLNAPGSLAFGPAGLYLIDAANDRLRLIGPTGTIRTVAARGVDLGPETRYSALDAPMRRPIGLAIDPRDGLPTWTDQALGMVFHLTASGEVLAVAGALPGAPEAAEGGEALGFALSHPTGLVYDAEGALYVADTGAMAIRRIDPEGAITTVAGLGLQATLVALFASPREGLLATEAPLAAPGALAIDAEGRLYVAELGTRAIAELGLSEKLPEGLTLPDVPARVRRIETDGLLRTIAGPGGRALSAESGDDSLQRPLGLAFDSEGRLVVADAGLNSIRRLVP